MIHAARVQLSGRTGSGRVAHLWPVGKGWSGFNRFVLEAILDQSVLPAANVAWHAGVAETELMRWVDGDTEPTLAEVEALADALAVHVDLFYAGRTPRTGFRYDSEGNRVDHHDLAPDTDETTAGGVVLPFPATAGQGTLPGL